MNLVNLPDGYEFRGFFEHNQVAFIKCSLNENEFSKYSAILSYLKKAIKNNREGYLEDIAEEISKKTTYSQNDIIHVIENFVFSDSKYEEMIAQLNYIETYQYENGIIKKILFS